MKKFSSDFSSNYTADYTISMPDMTQNQPSVMKSNNNFKAQPATTENAYSGSSSVTDQGVVISSVHSITDNTKSENRVSVQGTFNKARPIFSGTAGVGEIVELSRGDTTLGSTQADAFGRWSLVITTELAIGTHEVVAKTGTHQSEAFVVKIESVDTSLTLSLHQSESKEVIEDGSFISSIPTILGTAAPFSEVGLTYTTEHGVFFANVYADGQGKWQQSPDFLYIDKLVGSRVEIEASSADISSGKYVVNISPMPTDFMTEVLISNHISLFDEMTEAEFEENLILTINESDMQYQSEGGIREVYLSRPTITISQEEEYYLSNVM